MKTRPFSLLASLLMIAGVTFAQSRTTPLVIRNVTLIDGTGAPGRPHTTVVMSGRRIVAIGNRAQRIPRGARVVDGTGRYLIPGLWDMHVHFWHDDPLLELYIANGVTGVRDMGSRFERTDQYRREIGQGRRTGPRIVTSGVPLDGMPSAEAHVPINVVKTPDEARAAVRSLKLQGADFVKVLTSLSAESLTAVLEESKRQGFTVVGHVPDSIRPARASDLGMKSMEHLFGISLACSAREDELRRARTDAIARNDGVDYARARDEILATYDQSKAKALFERFARNGTWQTPTLTLLQRMYYQFEADPMADPRKRYIPSSVRKGWHNPLDELKGFSEATREYVQKTFERSLQLTAAMKKEGVAILAGTDTGDPFTYPGFTLHEELRLLVKSGLTPMEALQSATRDPARFLGLDASLGTVEEGKLADLVLLSADPLAEIGNTRRIEAVIANGNFFGRRQLESLRQVKK